MTELEAAFDTIARRGSARGVDAVVEAALRGATPVGRSPRRATRRVLLSAAVTLVLVTTAVAVYLRDRVDDINRVDVSAALTGQTVGPSEPTTLLIVGVDRSLESDVGRADVVMLARFDPRARTLAVLSIPRDTRVRIPGTDRDDRLSSAYAAGPSQLIDVVAGVTGIRPDHYVEVGYAGFAKLVDAVGGVQLHFPAPVRDQLSGLSVAAGCQTLDGVTALAFVRARHLQIRQPDGRYVTDPTGDLGRIQRQAELLNSAVADFAANVAGHPTRINRMANAAADALTLDSALSVRDFVARVRDFSEHPPARAFLVVPTVVGTLGDAAVLDVDPAQLDDVIALFNAPPSADRVDGPAC